MSKTFRLLAPAALALLAAPPALAAPLGDAVGCRPGSGAAALVEVEGLKARTGSVRVAVYGADPANFLAKGRWLKRIDVPVPRTGPIVVCVPLPHAGNYAFAVRHDVDGGGKSDWSDGGGFSRNPKLSLLDFKPNYQEVALPIGAAPKTIQIVMNYRHGLSIGPVRN